MLTYNGSLVFNTPLSDQECKFLNNWQKLLKNVYEQQSQTSDKQEKANIALQINEAIGIDLTKDQLWTIMFAYNPLISFTNDRILIKGWHKKGQLREALLSYEHLFIGDNPIFTNFLYQDLNFIKKHTFTGIVQAAKYSDKAHNKEWCYLFEQDYVASIDCESKEKYLKNPTIYELDIKKDSFIDKLTKYFPKEFIYYAKIKQLTHDSVHVAKTIHTPRKKI